jgi:hypothetical protein
MRGQHVSFCCKCYHKPPAKTHALETEALKKQLAQSYALLHFMSQRRKVHHNPQTDNEMINTTQFIEHLKKLLGMKNQVTPSIPQDQATQTDPANPENPPEPKNPEDPANPEPKNPEDQGSQTEETEDEPEEHETDEDTGDITTEDSKDEKQSFVFLFLLNHTTQSPEDAERKVLAMDEDELNKQVEHAKKTWGQKYKKYVKESKVHTLQELVETAERKKSR